MKEINDNEKTRERKRQQEYFMTKLELYLQKKNDTIKWHLLLQYLNRATMYALYIHVKCYYPYNINKRLCVKTNVL